jgi:hypothetical protein
VSARDFVDSVPDVSSPDVRCKKQHGTPDDDTVHRLEEAAAEVGRQIGRRSGGQITTAVDSREATWPARFDERADGTWLVVDIAYVEEASAESRSAIAHFILEMNAWLRVSRIVCEDASANVNVRGEVHIGQPSPRALDHAVRALSTACDFTARELRSLGNPSVATVFLRLRGSAPNANGLPPGDHNEKEEGND